MMKSTVVFRQWHRILTIYNRIFRRFGIRSQIIRIFKKNLEDISPFACFLACVILRFTSGATPADCIEVSMVAESFLIHISADVSASIGGGSGFEPTTVRATRSKHGAVYHSATLVRHK